MKEVMSLDIYLKFTVDTGGPKPKEFVVYEANYTHNCVPMAKEAGIYKCVWRPEECPEIKTAKDLIEPLRNGIKQMEDDPSRFIEFEFDLPNGCGDYETFLSWLRCYLRACIENPKAEVYACR